MHPLDGLAGQIAWAGKNISYNLGFIPEDKLSWKPAPTAKNAFEITAEVEGVADGMRAVINGGEWPNALPAPPTSLKEAQERIERATDTYAALLRTLDPSRFGETVKLPFMEMPFVRAVSLPAIEAVHHHGQICYIQTLLGDTESHFYEMANQ